MASEPEDPKSPPPGLLERARLPVAFLLTFLLALGGYYFFYVEKKSSYLMARNFRLLATFGDGVNASLVSRGKVFHSYVQDPLGTPPGFSRCSWEKEPRKNQDETLISLVEKPVNHLAFARSDGRCDLDLGELLHPLLDSKGAFDAVLLVEPDGDVVYQDGGPTLGVTHLDLDSRKPKPEKPGQGKPEPNASEKAAVQSFHLLGSSVEGHNVVLGGRDYKLFVEPLRLPIAIPEDSVSAPWFLCGLVSADKFVYKSMAVSSSLLLEMLVTLILAVLSWPLIKLRLLGERQRIRLVDVLLLGASSVIGVAVLTLSILDFSAYREFKDISRSQLQDFASKMAENVHTELAVANEKLKELKERAGTASQASLDEPKSTAVPLPGQTSELWLDFSLIDEKGTQRVKWTPPDRDPLPKVEVGERPYFKRTLAGDTTAYPVAADGKGRAFVESVTAWTTGLNEAVVATPVSYDHLPGEGLVVAALGVPLHSVIGPLVPPGFEFAVIDDQGRVLFHSNPARNGIEDFFAETDADPHLHSAVFARHREAMDLRYFGEDYMAALEPVRDYPWTVVALRNKASLRSLNMDWMVTSLLFLLLLVICPLALTVVLIALVRPRYRAPWIWPDPTRSQEYLNLAVLLAIDCLAFGLALHLLPPGKQVLSLAAIMPFVALGTSYAALERQKNGTDSKGVAATFGILFLVLAVLSLGAGHAGSTTTREVCAAIFVVCGCLLSSLRPSFGFRAPSGVARSYPLAALMLLVMTIVLPATGIFRSVHRIELDSFVRHGQLKIARGLGAVSRVFPKERPAASTATLNFYGYSFFSTHKGDMEDQGPCETREEEDSPLPELLESLLPHYSPNSSEMRELLHGRATDCSWDAHPEQDGTLELHSNIDKIRLISSLTPPADKANEVTHAGFLSWGDEVPGRLLGGIPLIAALLYALVLFLSRRLFLLGLLEPVWGTQQTPPAMIAGRNLFLVSGDRVPPEATEGLKLLDLQNIDPAAKDWGTLRREILDSREDVVLVTGFEHQILDRSVNTRKLILLEDLAEQHERTVVILSRVSPRRLLDAQKKSAPRPEGARWRSLLARFTVVEEDFRCSRQNRPGFLRSVLTAIFSRHRLQKPATEPNDLPPLLKNESGGDPFLRKIARGLVPHSQGMDDEQLLEEFEERAENHYREIWESCSMDEKVVLQHVAEEGLVNEKSRRVLRRLMAAGLIRREPNFCLMNETFRRFVASPVCRGEADLLEQRAKPSAWDRLRWPLLCILAATLAFFFATQQELLDSTTVLVTGLAAGLPAVAKLVDLLNGRRSVAAKAG